MKKLSKVIYEVNGRDTFVKAKNNSFGIEKVVFSFVKYDEKSNNKMLHGGDYYLDFASCLSLCRDIDKGLLQRDIRTELERCKKENQKYAKPVRQFQGGITEEKAKRSDGFALARIMSIEPGTSNPAQYPYILKYTEGPAKTDPSSKLITPLWWSDKSKKADFQIFVPCTEADIIKLALLLSSHITGYITNCYATDKYLVEYEEKGAKQSEATAPAKTFQAPKQTTSKAKPHNSVASATTKVQQDEGVTSEKRQMKVQFTSAPAYIEGSEGLYTTEVMISGKKLQLYFTSDAYKVNKEKINNVCKTQEIVEIKYVIVKDPQNEKEKFTYFMGFAK